MSSIRGVPKGPTDSCSLFRVWPVNDGDHAPDKLEATFRTSLAALKVPSVRVLYLHKPDRSVPFEDTCRKMNELHREGLFQRFGLSNFAAWEVAEVVGICKANGWVQPGIYQAYVLGLSSTSFELANDSFFQDVQRYCAPD